MKKLNLNFWQTNWHCKQIPARDIAAKIRRVPESLLRRFSVRYNQTLKCLMLRTIHIWYVEIMRIYYAQKFSNESIGHTLSAALYAPLTPPRPKIIFADPGPQNCKMSHNFLVDGIILLQTIYILNIRFCTFEGWNFNFCSCSLKYSLIFEILSFDRSLSKENQSYSVLVKKYWKAILVHIEKDLFSVLYLQKLQFPISTSEQRIQSSCSLFCLFNLQRSFWRIPSFLLI